jgi:hypothetical protein
MLTIKASGYGLGGLFAKRKDSQSLLGGAEYSDEKENAAQRDATVRADLDGAQLNGIHVDPSTLKIKKAPKGSPLRVGDQIFAINGERVEPDGAAGPLAALLRGLDHVSLLATRAPRAPLEDANPFGY